jgi:hypothetical protein
MVRTCQSLLGQTGTRLGLLLLHVGSNGDGFGGQAFMEHYIGFVGSLSLWASDMSFWVVGMAFKAGICKA